MHYIELFSAWLKMTKLSAAVLHYSWVWPTCEILHFVGMAFLIGFVSLLDFRILGVGKGLPMSGHLLELFETSGSDDDWEKGDKVGTFSPGTMSREDRAEATGTPLRDPDEWN